MLPSRGWSDGGCYQGTDGRQGVGCEFVRAFSIPPGKCPGRQCRGTGALTARDRRRVDSAQSTLMVSRLTAPVTWSLGLTNHKHGLAVSRQSAGRSGVFSEQKASGLSRNPCSKTSSHRQSILESSDSSLCADPISEACRLTRSEEQKAAARKL
jgi:hypothetical protein